ncbi:MAG: hypothetical protein WCT12_03130 [Verrucomicrobiota bacterium]
MRFSVVFQRVQDSGFPGGYYRAAVPGFGLATHSPGVGGTRQVAADRPRLWLVEKRANGEDVAASCETLFGTFEVSEGASQSA